ncbi:MAG: hypothetical protein CME21_09425 [Gemmatimonadetes bacterium]|nr:hypothetical protein [Gemmatimonadota bacterium]
MRGSFDVRSDAFFFYPAYYHQNPRILKPDNRCWFGDEPDTVGDDVTIGLYAELADTIWIGDMPALYGLKSHFIWTTDYIRDWFYWKSEKSLTLQLLRPFKLDHPGTLTVLPDYAGCLSRIEPEKTIKVSECNPVLNDIDRAREGDAILDVVSSVTS